MDICLRVLMSSSVDIGVVLATLLTFAVMQRGKNKMTAKEYLRQIRQIDHQLANLLKERQELEKAQTFLRSPQIDGDRVQTSPSGDPPWMGYIIRWEELTLKIGETWDELIDKKQLIISQINLLTDTRYMDILMKRYVEFKRFGKIAREMHYSESRILHLHWEALCAFQHIIA